MGFLPFLSCLLLLLFLVQSQASDIPLGSTLTPSNSSSWTSPSQSFSFGFISSSSNPSLYVAAITYSGGIPVWSVGAVDSSGYLQLRLDGNLRLLNGSGSVVWESNTTSKGVTAASLLETGNLVLKNATAAIWESFDNPTDTILESQNFTSGKVLRSGIYSFSLLESGNLTLRWNDSVRYFNKGFKSSFTANKTLISPVLTLQTNGIVSLYDDSLNTSVAIAYSSNYGETGVMLRFMRIDSDGNFRAYSSAKGSGIQTEQWSAISDQCEVFGFCGNMGICSYNDTSPICGCPSQNFEFIDPNDNKKGCKRKTEIQDCPGNSTMLELDHTQFLTYYPDINNEQFFVGISACKSNCLSGPSCVASTALADGSGLCYIKVSKFVSGYQSAALPSTSYVKVCLPAAPNP